MYKYYSQDSPSQIGKHFLFFSFTQGTIFVVVGFASPHNHMRQFLTINRNYRKENVPTHPFVGLALALVTFK
ncbi:hypothetical protein A6U96_22845 [Agrobacterium tumefaciens]|nr:hypothetical protein A6U96_22845 [Agrobacterium tumefaciens]